MIEIKKFTFDNSELMKIAHQIRHVVFVIGQNCPEELEWEYEEESTHFLVLDNGKLIEIGTHEKLIKNNGHYKKLHDIQFT